MASADLAGLGILALLLTLPGGLAVRAPWTAVPFLSLAFWIVSWGWMPDAGRTRIVVGLLLVFGLLALLRLARPLYAARPRAAAAVVATVAGVWWLVPVLGLPVAPGTPMSLESAAARLFVWRDGVPSTWEPLYPIHTFGAHALAALAADVSLLSGLSPVRATLWIAVTAHALLTIAVFAAVRCTRAARQAAALAVASAVALSVPALVLGANAEALSLAFGLIALAVFVAHRGLASALAAGLTAAAAVVCHGIVGAATFVALLAFAISSRGRDPTAEWRRRTGMAAAVAVLFAAPFGTRLLRGQWRPGSWPARTVLPAADDLAAMAWIAEHTRPLDVVCHDADTAGLWIPALAGRGIRTPVVPPGYRDALAWRAAGRPCVYVYTRRSGAGAVVFQQGAVRLLRADARDRLSSQAP
jgi:hypothetical protein